MNKIYKILLGCSILMLTGCTDADYMESFEGAGKAGTATFTIATNDSGIGVITRSGGEEGKSTISDMLWLVSDMEGNIIDHHYGRLTDNFSKLTLEGLRYGDYNLLFLATLKGSEHASIEVPRNFSDPWLSVMKDGKPLDGYYCYKKVPFSVGPAGTNVEVILEHCAARVYVDVKMPNVSQWRYIKRVSVTFNEKVPAAIDAGGTYIGTGSVRNYDVYNPNGVFSFTTFPTDAPVSGYVEIESTRDDAENFVQRYEFSDLNLEAGKSAHINLEYRHPEKESGMMYIMADELWRFNPDTMLLASEPKEVFYDNSIRQFYADQPLQMNVNDEGALRVKFYSPILIKNVRVKARFSKLSSEWVDFAYFDEIQPFVDVTFPLPVKEKECIYTGVSGRKIRIPAQPNLTGKDVELSVECDDPFMQKIATINSHWNIRFSPYQTDQGHAYWRHMTPLLCRHAIALALNMAFMFSSPEFNEELQKYDGILYDNAQNPINLDALRNNIRNHGGLKMGRVVGVGGLGGGQTYGLADYCYTGVYHNSTPEGSNPHNYPREAMFHEYGHCLGYSHSSNMTYGNAWTVICAKIFVELGRAGKLPVSNITDVTDLPME